MQDSLPPIINISMVRGTSETFEIPIVSPNGEAYTLQTGESIKFGVKKVYSDNSYILEKTLTNSNLQDGAYQLNILPSDTENIPIGSYVYDVGVISGSSNYYMIIRESEFELLPNVTKR